MKEYLQIVSMSEPPTPLFGCIESFTGDLPVEDSLFPAHFDSFRRKDIYVAYQHVPSLENNI